MWGTVHVPVEDWANAFWEMEQKTFMAKFRHGSDKNTQREETRFIH